MRSHLRLPTSPVARPEAVVQGDRWRITVLTDGLVRLEWSEDGAFEDRASTVRARTATCRCRSSTVIDGEATARDRHRPPAADLRPRAVQPAGLQRPGARQHQLLPQRLALRRAPVETSAAPRARSTTSTARIAARARRSSRRDGVDRARRLPLGRCSTTTAGSRRAADGGTRPLRLRLRPRLPRRAARASTPSPAARRCCRASRSATGGAATTPTPPTSTSS